MTKKGMMMTMALLAPTLLLAAGKDDPVAEGYPDWQGLTAKSYIMGRELCPSDLRHKVTIVVEIEPNDKLQEQLVMASSFARKVELPTVWGGDNWETLELKRDVAFVISNRGGGKAKDHEAIVAALKYKGEDQDISRGLTEYRGMACSMYDDVTFTGAPDTTGKRPYVYVMGPEGKEPLCQGELTAATMKAANVAINKAKKQIEGWETKWRPFYGNIAEPKFNTLLAKTLAKGKAAKMAPLDPVEKALLKDIASKDPEKSKEAQILYDAVCQTRSDLVMRIKMEVGTCPHRAYYDVQQLVRHWPSEKKRLEKAYAAFKNVPEAEKMGKMFLKLKAWADPDFTCKNAGEAKKIVAELNKMKKELEKYKESKVIIVQNGALVMDSQVDELISFIPAKVAEK